MLQILQIDESRCIGCGECIEVCPEGALYLVNSLATIDHDRCSHCEACITACPQAAIRLVPQAMSLPESREPRPAPTSVIDVLPVQRGTLSLPQKVLPALAAVASFAGRELVPRLLDAILVLPQQRQVEEQNQHASAQGQGVGGKRFRQRQRGRHGDQ